MSDFFSGLAVAFSLYSAIPVPHVEWKKNTMRWALAFLPLVGVLVGACEFGWLVLARSLGLTAMLYAVVAAAIPVVLTGGIHLDGFTDTADALCSYGEREKRLEILKDPHIGAFGVLWLLLLLLVQTGLFTQLYAASNGAPLLLFGYACARALGGGMIVTQPCAKDSGLARLFADHADKKPVAAAHGVWFVLCAAAMTAAHTVCGLLLAIVCALFWLWFTRKCRVIFGGITGDLCGMCITVCELLMLTAAVIGGMV